MISKAYSSQAETQKFPDEWYSIATENHFWMKWRLSAFLKQASDMCFSMNMPFRGLEIGCGYGVLRRQLESVSSWVIDGSDLNAKSLSKNNSFRGETFFYDINDCRAELQSRYDFIIIFDVMEHIADDKSFIKSALFHLKKGGYIFINVPALNVFHGEYDKAVGHLRRYDKRMIRHILKDMVEIKDMRYWGISMIPLLFIRKISDLRKRSSLETIKRGFKPPNKLFDSLIIGIMKSELFLLDRPVIGTSLLVAAIKK